MFHIINYIITMTAACKHTTMSYIISILYSKRISCRRMKVGNICRLNDIEKQYFMIKEWQSRQKHETESAKQHTWFAYVITSEKPTSRALIFMYRLWHIRLDRHTILWQLLLLQRLKPSKVRVSTFKHNKIASTGTVSNQFKRFYQSQCVHTWGERAKEKLRPNNKTCLSTKHILANMRSEVCCLYIIW